MALHFNHRRPVLCLLLSQFDERERIDLQSNKSLAQFANAQASVQFYRHHGSDLVFAGHS